MEWNSEFPDAKVLDDDGQPNAGFCTHTSIIFLTWHRPYLALYEVCSLLSAPSRATLMYGYCQSTLYAHVQAAASEIDDKDPDKERYLQAAKNFRIPYW